MRAVAHNIGGFLLAVRQGFGDVFAKINAANQLPHNHQINAAGHNLRLQRRGKIQLRKKPGRPHVGIQPHRRAQAQQTALRPHVAGQLVPFIAANSAQQHAVAGLAGGNGLLRQRHPMLINGTAAHINVNIIKFMPKFARHGLQHLQRGVHNLRANAVATDNRNRFFHFAITPILSEFSKPPLAIIFWINSGNGSVL